ncbi:MAG: methylenetetrahydrofolate reductase [NAD(P)H] [Oscillospiraceae bacterium]|nr:methylenetetrahydrofolate reductase [NAD(P)H] [Candidatus Equicaccousia limihippi]
MKISEKLSQKRFSVSFEVFPPKTETAFDSVKTAVKEIAALNPSFISVTYGAGDGTSPYTLENARKIQASQGVVSLAHLTCVSSTRQTVRERISEFSDAGIENIMALRGDIPKDRLGEDRTNWDYHHAIDLVKELKEASPDFCIGGACYPEVHPESANEQEDILHLKEKVDAGCDFLTTQMFFENELFYSFLDKIAAKNINVPVLPGIMPITNANQIERAISLSGSYVPKRFSAIANRFCDNPLAMKQAGIAYATDQIIDLFANGIYHVHVYSMNKPDVAAAIMNNLSNIIGEK